MKKYARKGSAIKHELDTIFKKEKRVARNKELKKWAEESEKLIQAHSTPYGKYGRKWN